MLETGSVLPSIVDVVDHNRIYSSQANTHGLGALALNQEVLGEVLNQERVDLEELTKHGVEFKGIHFAANGIAGSYQSNRPPGIFDNYHGVFDISDGVLPNRSTRSAAIILDTPKIATDSERGVSVLHSMVCASVSLQGNLSATLLREILYVKAFLATGDNNPVPRLDRHMNRLYRFMGRGRTITAADKLELRQEVAARQAREQLFTAKTAAILAKRPDFRELIQTDQ